MKSIFCHKAKAVPPAANTLRFEFGNQSYNPVTAGVGSSGTWKRCEFMPGNVWDWTNTNTSWATAFGGGGVGIPGAFADYENNPVKVIAAGDTSSVTDFSRFFQNCYAITEVCPIDTSEATNVMLMFSSCTNCEKFPNMDFSSATASNGTVGVYQSCLKMITAPNIVFPNQAYSLQNFFYSCENLTSIPLLDTSSCTSMQAMFHRCTSLTSIPLLDTSNVTNMQYTFKNCISLTTIPLFDTSNVTNMYGMLSCTLKGHSMHLESVPNFDYSACKNFKEFMGYNSEITEIPEMNIEAAVTDVTSMFYECINVKSGQKALYDKLSAISTINNHADCFKNCGSDTEEGHAELAQIPASWGGTKEEV